MEGPAATTAGPGLLEQKPMCKETLAALEPDATTTKRAQYEAFEFALEAPGLIRVTNGSYGDDAVDHSYLVNVEEGIPTACECPAFEYQPGACKHMVAIAIREPVLEAATTEVATDGGELVDEDDTDGDENEEGEWVDPIAMDVFGMSFDEWHAAARENLRIEEPDR